MGGKGTCPIHSSIVQTLHERWQQGDDPVAVRLAEDERAVKSLGAFPQRMTVWTDCIYRTTRSGQPLYVSEESLFGDVHPDDVAGQLLPTIVLSPLEHFRAVYAPLGVGNHVDHQIVRLWALELRKQYPGISFRFYEEYPYSERPDTLEKALQFFRERNFQLEAETVRLDETNLSAKIQAIAAYVSQLSTWWPNVEAMRQAVRQAALRVGNGSPAERYWRAVS